MILPLDVTILAVSLLIQGFLTIVALWSKSVYAIFFATLTGFLMGAAMAGANGLLTYGNTVIQPNPFFLVIITMPTFYDMFALIAMHTPQRRK